MSENKEDIDATLEICERVLDGDVYVLATEVRRLRAELSETQVHLRTALDAGEAAELRIVQLRATIARVAALPAKWRDQAMPTWMCVDELEAALKGGA